MGEREATGDRLVADFSENPGVLRLDGSNASGLCSRAELPPEFRNTAAGARILREPPIDQLLCVHYHRTPQKGPFHSAE